MRRFLMRRFLWPLFALTLMLPPLVLPQVATAQSAKDLPHSFLFGAWVGGVFPPPTTLSGRECMAHPTVIFTRDVVMRANMMEVTFTQFMVETVRDSGRGLEFRLLSASGAPMSAGALGGGPAADPGFDCGDPGLLRVQKRGENEISFPNCGEYPYPLIRCPSH